MTSDQTLRVSVQPQSGSTASNHGIGGYDEASAPTATDEHGTFVRIQEAGPLGRRFFIEHARCSSTGRRPRRVRRVEAPTSASSTRFTTRRRAAARRPSSTSAQPAVGPGLRPRHPLVPDRASASTAAAYHSDESSNYLGTYTFESLDAFEAGTPRSYTQRIGDPNIGYNNVCRPASTSRTTSACART